MQYKVFRELFGQACEIEAIIKAEYKEKIKNRIESVNKNNKGNKDAENNEPKRFKFATFIKKRKELEKKYTEWRRLNRDQKAREAQSERYSQLSKELITDKKTLLTLCAEHQVPLQQMDLFILKCYRECYIQENSPAYKYLLQHGLTKKDYEKFLKLDRSKAGNNIPEVLIDGKTLGHPGYYLRKAQVLDELEAARVACLGKLTGCCQSLSGEAGETCVIHGLTSPNGGFYILCQGDVHNPQVSDNVIAQSWVWRSKTNALVFDSIEGHSTSNSIIKDLYSALSKRFCLDENVPKVVHGFSRHVMRSYIKSSLISDLKVDAFELERFIDYKYYNDSNEQRCIYDKNNLFYFYATDDDAKALTDKLIESVFKNKAFFTESPDFCKILNWIIIEKNNSLNNLLDKLFKTAQYFQREKELQSFIDNLRYFIDTEDLDLEKIAHWIKDNKFWIHCRKVDGSTILHKAIANPESFKMIFVLFPKQERLASVQVKNSHFDMVLFDATNYPSSLQNILELIPEEQRLELIQTRKIINPAGIVTMQCKEVKDGTILHQIVQNPTLLQWLLSLYSKSERLDIIQVKDSDGCTVLHKAAPYPSSLNIILDVYFEQNRLAAVQVKDKLGNTVLSYATRHPDSLKVVLEPMALS